MVLFIEVSIFVADLALPCCGIIELKIFKDASAADYVVVDWLLAAKTHLTSSSLDVEELVNLAIGASLVA